MGIEIMWKSVPKQFLDESIYGYVGDNIPIFMIQSSKEFATKDNDNKATKLIGNLPGIKRDLGFFKNSKNATKKALLVYYYWLKKMKLREDKRIELKKIKD
jgi:hypothetical protein